MKFYVKWLNYDSSHNSWEPWKSMRSTDQLHKYLRENNMLHVIPREFRLAPPAVMENPWMISMKIAPKFFLTSMLIEIFYMEVSQ